MKERYNSAARAEAEKLLIEMGVTYTPQADGSLYVSGSIDLANRALTALPDLSMVDVRDDFFCEGNQLQDLTGAPRSVQGWFNCSSNQLSSLKGAPTECADFDCRANKLTSLAGGPEKVISANCEGNNLTSLEHAPAVFAELESDFGKFKSWSQVPEELQISAETRQRRIDEAEAPIRAMEQAIRSVTILDTPIRVGKALRYRR